MKNEYVIERQGKKHVLYAGLLDDAHEKGLIGIEVEELEAVYDKDDNLPLRARHKATVWMLPIVHPDRDPFMLTDGDHPATHVAKFTGHGDADRTNVARHMIPSLFRMSETRAKARALRDAVNVGAAAFEELGEDSSGPSEAPERPRKGRGGSGPSPTPPEPEEGPVERVAKKPTLRVLAGLITQEAHTRNVSPRDVRQELEDRLGMSMADLNEDEAREEIARYQTRLGIDQEQEEE